MIIQGGMGVGVSSWRLARSVARLGEFGVVSGTGIDTVLVRELQQGDRLPDGEILGVKGPLDRPVSGLVIDSRRVVPGTLFFALPGRRTDGSAFVDEAISPEEIARCSIEYMLRIQAEID